MFLQVDFREKGIRLYNSMGLANPKNRKYLLLMQKYLYDMESPPIADMTLENGN